MTTQNDESETTTTVDGPTETQARLFGEPSGESIEIETDGRMIRPFIDVFSPLVDEAKLQFHEDGLTVAAVDKANVAMVDVTINAEAFDCYDLLADGEVVIGTNVSRLQGQLRSARKGKSTADDVALEFDETRTLVTTQRDYATTTLTQTGEMLNIDSGSIREIPEIPDLYDDLGWTADVDVDAFADAIKAIDRDSDHAVVKESNGSLIIGTKGADENTGMYGTVAEFEGVAEKTDAEDGPQEGGEESMFSVDYLAKFADSLKSMHADELTLTWGAEYPLYVRFSRPLPGDEDGVAYEGRYMTAPRIQSD